MDSGRNENENKEDERTNEELIPGSEMHIVNSCIYEVCRSICKIITPKKNSVRAIQTLFIRQKTGAVHRCLKIQIKVLVLFTDRMAQTNCLFIFLSSNIITLYRVLSTV